MNWNRISLKVPHGTPYSKRVHRLATQKVGTITPIYFTEAIPGSETKLDIAMNMSFPPLASDCFADIDYRVEAFFVPSRLLMLNYDEYFATANIKFVNSSGGVTNSQPALPPVVRFTSPVGTSTAETLFLNNTHAKYFGPGSLADYLGFRQQVSWFGDSTHTNNSPEMSLLPFLSYWRIIDDWYKCPKVQTPCFAKLNAGNTSVYRLRSAPFQPFYQSNYLFTEPVNNTDWHNLFDLCDGHCIFDLAQRNWDYDMYSTALPNVPDESVGVEASGSPSPSSWSMLISKFYAANAMYQYKQRKNLVSDRYVDQLAARYGAKLPDAIAQRSVLLGSGSFNMLTSGVMQNAPDTSASTSTNNPFTGVGSRYGQAYINGNNFSVRFRAEEAGYVFVMGTITPKASYAFGTNPILRKYRHAGSIVDMPDHILEQTGMVKVPVQDIAESTQYDDNMQYVGLDLFGYQSPYYPNKDEVSTVHGLFRAGQSLDSFVTQRALSAVPTAGVAISSNFLEIPTDACDNITAVTAELSQYGGIGDFVIRSRQKLPVSVTPLPTLIDPASEHGKTVSVPTQGKQIR